jgi:hypothetical protein
MFYVIPDILLTVLLNTNKLVTILYVIPDTLLKVLLNINKTGHHVLRYQQYVRYNVEHGDQFYWCLTPLSTMCQV